MATKKTTHPHKMAAHTKSTAKHLKPAHVATTTPSTSSSTLAYIPLSQVATPGSRAYDSHTLLPGAATGAVLASALVLALVGMALIVRARRQPITNSQTQAPA